jgi:hypothetical protein
MTASQAISYLLKHWEITHVCADRFQTPLRARATFTLSMPSAQQLY